jgi:hypothetical protein
MLLLEVAVLGDVPRISGFEVDRAGVYIELAQNK